MSRDVLPRQETLPTKGRSIVEVVAAFVLMKVLSIGLDSWLVSMGVSPPWRTFFFGAQAIVIPLAVVWILRRSWSAYGFRVSNMRSIIHYGFVGTILMMVVGMGFGFLKSQRVDPRGMSGSLFMSGVAIVVVFLFMIITRTAGETENPKTARPFRAGYKVAILLALVGCPIVVAAARNADVAEIIAWDAYFLVMVGLGEEIKYRGYFQSRINEQYGRPWQLLGVSFGPGLIIVSVIFGLSHVAQFGTFNPFLGHYDLKPWMGLQAGLGSLLFGLIREKSGSVFASGIAHGVPNAFGQVLAMALR